MIVFFFQDLVIAKKEKDREAVVIAIAAIVIAVQETNDHKTIIIFLQRYQPTSKPH